MIKLGLIGCGRVAETCHLPALQNVAGAEVVAVADRDPERLKLVAERFHVKRRYHNWNVRWEIDDTLCRWCWLR